MRVEGCAVGGTQGRGGRQKGERREITEHGHAPGVETIHSHSKVLGLPNVIYQADKVCCGYVQ